MKAGDEASYPKFNLFRINSLFWQKLHYFKHFLAVLKQQQNWMTYFQKLVEPILELEKIPLSTGDHLRTYNGNPYPAPRGYKGLKRLNWRKNIWLV